MLMVRLLAGRFSRAERARRRRKINLEDASLTDKTRTRYYNALRKVLPTVEDATSPESLDCRLCQWIHTMWYEGEPLLTIGDALSALHFFQPWTRRQVPHSWKLFSTWRKLEIPSRAPPLTWQLVCSLAAFELAHNNLEMSCILLVGFHCLLRTGECLSLTPADLMLGSTSGLCTLKNTKSGVRHNASEAISIQNTIVLEVLRTLLDIRRIQGTTALPIWSSTGSQFRRRFTWLCNHFGLHEHNFRPYSLRRGGATAVFQSTLSMEAALVRGRWTSSRVARIYISDGLSFLPSLKMSSRTSSLLNKYSFLDPKNGVDAGAGMRGRWPFVESSAETNQFIFRAKLLPWRVEHLYHEMQMIRKK